MNTENTEDITTDDIAVLVDELLSGGGALTGQDAAAAFTALLREMLPILGTVKFLVDIPSIVEAANEVDAEARPEEAAAAQRLSGLAVAVGAVITLLDESAEASEAEDSAV